VVAAWGSPRPEPGFAHPDRVGDRAAFTGGTPMMPSRRLVVFYLVPALFLYCSGCGCCCGWGARGAASPQTRRTASNYVSVMLVAAISQSRRSSEREHALATYVGARRTFGHRRGLDPPHAVVSQHHPYPVPHFLATAGEQIPRWREKPGPPDGECNQATPSARRRRRQIRPSRVTAWLVLRSRGVRVATSLVAVTSLDGAATAAGPACDRGGSAI